MPAELCEPPYKTALCPVQASHHSQHKSKEHTWIKHWILLVQQFSTHQKQTQKCTFLFPMLHEISTCGKLPSKVICTAKSETIRVSTEINWFYIVLAEDVSLVIYPLATMSGILSLTRTFTSLINTPESMQECDLQFLGTTSCPENKLKQLAT